MDTGLRDYLLSFDPPEFSYVLPGFLVSKPNPMIEKLVEQIRKDMNDGKLKYPYQIITRYGGNSE